MTHCPLKVRSKTYMYCVDVTCSIKPALQLHMLLHHFLVDDCHHQSCGTVWLRTRGTTTSAGSSTPRPSLSMEWVVLGRNDLLLAPGLHICLFTNIRIDTKPMIVTYLLTAATWRAGRAIQKENNSHHRQPLPIHQNQDTGTTTDWFPQKHLFWTCCIFLDRWLTRSRSSWPQLRWPSRTFRWRSTQLWWWGTGVPCVWWDENIKCEAMRNRIAHWIRWRSSTLPSSRTIQRFYRWSCKAVLEPQSIRWWPPEVGYWCFWPTMPHAGSHWDCPGVLARTLWGQSAKQTWKQA